MKFWHFVNATARLIKRVQKDAQSIRAQFIRLMEDFAHLITNAERMQACLYIFNLR